MPLSEGVAVRVLRAVHGHSTAAAELAATLTPGERTGQLPLPDPLARRLPTTEGHRARLARLPAPSRRLLLLAAADQHPVDSRAFLRAVAATGLDTADLAPAEEAGLVRSTAAGPVFPDALLRAVVYDSARPEDRRSAHQLLARVLDPRSERGPWNWHRACAALGPSRRLARDLAAAPAPDPVTASHHCERAALLDPDPEGRLRGLATAAVHAWQGGQSDRARTLLAAAEHLAATVCDGDSRVPLLRGIITLRSGHAPAALDDLAAAATGEPHTPARAVRALALVAEVGHYTGDLRRCHQAARASEALARRCPPSADPAVHALLAGLIGTAASGRGRDGEGIDRLRESVTEARRSDDPAALVLATVSALCLGDDDQALAASRHAETAARAQGDAAALPRALEFRAYAEVWSGRLPAATSTALRALRLAHETGQDNIACHLQAGLALIAAIQGDAGTCLARVRSAQAHAASHGLGLATALSIWALAYLDLTRGLPAEAASRLRALARMRPGDGHPAIRRLATPHYVEAAARAGDEPAARAALAAYERWATTATSPSHLALVARCHALLATGEEALDRYREALELHDADGRHLERARTELLYGVALRRMRRRTEALDRLRSAHQAFERFGALLCAQHAAAELRAMGDSTPRPASTAAEGSGGAPTAPALQALTAQQLVVARMVAEGATNREIATRLTLSPRTVDHHLRSVYARLGICSRVELVRLVDA
ncbi:LuxR C-terminal-related transcriptional regulator [Streptomyces sp. NPDC085614]|uniref:helix-turn-helix transcriptional regulator n=1 Tax=Streptomyces sp. NPDC085614 TaxID=3365733 RepID=UPI0037D96B81